MNPSILHPTPGWRSAMEAELRSVGFAIRPALIVGGGLIVATTLLAGLAALREGADTDVTPELALIAALVACLLPIAVWKGEYHVQRSYLASLPVDRRLHTLAKIGAGWAWLIALTAALLLWMMGLAIVTGGEVGIDEMRVMARDLPSGALPADVDALARPWSTPAWQWAVLFTAPTVAYLFGSAIVLAGSPTRRWLAGVAVVCLFLSIVDDEVMHLGGVAERLDMFLIMIVGGRYGLQTLFTASDADLLTTAAGGEVIIWSNLPSVELWIAVTLLWTGLATASVAAVIWGGRKG